MTSQLLRVLPDRYVVVERQPGEVDAGADDWLAVVRAPEGRLTVIRAARPDDPSRLERRCALYGGDTAHGLDLPGMLAALLTPRPAAAVPVFVASTYAADLVLVPDHRLDDAAAALRAAGHRLSPLESP